MRKQLRAFVLLGAATFAGPRVLQALDLANESLATFTAQTTRVECFRLSRLRRLPNYADLRQRYLVGHLPSLEESFLQLGIRDADIDDLVLGWRTGPSTADLQGLLGGRFTAKSVADRAASASISPVNMGGLPAYCLGAGPVETCLVVLKDSLGIFGSQESIANMIVARAGRARRLLSDKRFVKLVREARTQAPMWGVAAGEAVADWVRVWLPPPGNLHMNWLRAFQSVKALVYTVETGDEVRFELKMECASDRSADRTRRVFEGLKRFQEHAWRNRPRTGRNPLEFVEINRDGPRVLVKMIISCPNGDKNIFVRPV